MANPALNDKIEAYLDQQMDEIERKAFEAAIAQSPDLAEAVAQKQAVRTLLGILYEGNVRERLENDTHFIVFEDDELDDAVPAGPTIPPRRPLKWLFGLFAALFVLGGLLCYFWPKQPISQPVKPAELQQTPEHTPMGTPSIDTSSRVNKTDTPSRAKQQPTASNNDLDNALYTALEQFRAEKIDVPSLAGDPSNATDVFAQIRPLLTIKAPQSNQRALDSLLNMAVFIQNQNTDQQAEYHLLLGYTLLLQKQFAAAAKALSQPVLEQSPTRKRLAHYLKWLSLMQDYATNKAEANRLYEVMQARNYEFADEAKRYLEKINRRGQ